jgi:type IV pilus assembly protein PilC
VALPSNYTDPLSPLPKPSSSGKTNGTAHKGGLLVRDISLQGTGGPVKSTGGLFQRRRVKGKELMVFTRQLSSTLGAGLLLMESLDAIAEDMENHFFKNVILAVRADVESGASFTQSLAKYPKIFNKTFIAIVKSGEATGGLYKTMETLAKYLEESEKLKEKVITATRYPLFVLAFAMIVVLVMVLFLIPQFAGMFNNSGTQLPLLTRIVVGVSNTMIRYFWALPLLVVLVVVGWLQARKFMAFRFFMDSVLLRLPVFGKELFFKVFMSRFCRTLAFLLAGGISVATALEITGQVVTNLPISQAIDQVRQRVLGGSEISTELRRQRMFSALVGRMASVGERTGRLPELLNRTADYYDSELDHSLSRLTSIIEPFLIIFIGGVVLIVVLALYLPIFNMSKAIR